MDKQDTTKNRIVLLRDSSKSGEEKKILLTEEEQELKKKLLEIESKIDSVENALNSIAQERENSLFGDKIFGTVVGTIAIAAATNLIAEYFNVTKEDLDNLI